MRVKSVLRSGTLFAGLMTLGVTGPAFAQNVEPEALPEQSEEETATEAEDIVITGSRIRRNTFNSVKPLQVITGDTSREIGLLDAETILQESTVSSGLQIDDTFNGFVLDNGPGSSTVNLRGLGANRTLTLLNGRRVAPTGVEGAPGTPSLEFIPTTLVERFDVLLDGASSIYGSDAVAGVVNAILRKDFDGLEVEFQTSQPFQDGGEISNASARWGVNSDRGFLGFAVEFEKEERLTLADRDSFGDCQTDYEITTDGQIRTRNQSIERGAPPSESDLFCSPGFINRISINPLPGEFGQFQSLYYLPPGINTDPVFVDNSNIGIPNFYELGLFGGNFDLDGDGFADVDYVGPFYQGQLQDNREAIDVIPESENFKAFSYGEYEFGRWHNLRAFYEAGFANLQTKIQGGQSRFFPATAPGNNPFNPCNIDAGGADCGFALNEAVFALFGGRLSDFGLEDVAEGVNRAAQTQVAVRIPGGDTTEIEINTQRLLFGLGGDLPLMDFGPLANWEWEAFASYDRSVGQSTRLGFNEERLGLSLATTIEDPDNPGEFICGVDVTGDGIPDPGVPFPDGASNITPPCVPVNIFAPSLFGIDGGTFATQEEFDYLFTRRTFDTVVEQSVVNGIATGDLLELPAGVVSAAFGFEYRYDEIDSDPDFVAENGVLLGFFFDRGATGSRSLTEFFGELELPILAGLPYAEEVSLNASARYTDESNFGSAGTYSLSGLYRPTSFLSFRASYGTSFRAPNLREQFILGQSGFGGVADPCIVPEAARGGPSNPYIAENDPREQFILDNCVAAGVDPTSLGIGASAPTPEIVTFQGNNLTEETSVSQTYGFVFEQPFTDAFDLRLSVNYYEIEVEDTLVEFGRQTVVDLCFDEPGLDPAFCSLIDRNSQGFISVVRTPFLNQDVESVRGMDFNVLFEKGFFVAGREIDLGIDFQASTILERTTEIRSPNSNDSISDPSEGEPYTSEWEVGIRTFVDYDQFRFTWNTTADSGTDDVTTQAFGRNDTCNGITRGDVNCRAVNSLDDYILHSASVRYNADTWTAVIGVNNVFDEEPQKADPGEIFLIPGTNHPFNQDILGRRITATVSKRF